MIFQSNIYFCLISSFISPFLQVYRKGLPGVSKRYMPVSNWYVGVSKRLCIELTGILFLYLQVRNKRRPIDQN